MNTSHDKYILDGHTPKPVNDLMEWAKWFETADRHVADDTIGGIRVSTVFLALNHSFNENDEPLLFETMIFGGNFDQYQVRCSTWEQAEQAHSDAVAIVSEEVYKQRK